MTETRNGGRNGGPPHRPGLPPLPRVGEVVAIGAAASVQFAGDKGFLLRVAQVDAERTYDGWVWLTGYVLDRRGEAVAKREIFVQRAGVRRVDGRQVDGQRAGVRAVRW